MKVTALVATMILPVASFCQFNVTFLVDMNMEIVSPNGVHIMGNFSDPNDDGTDENPGLINWDPAAYEMTDADMDGIYEYTFSLAEGVYEFKYINGNDGSSEETVPETCMAEEDTPYRQIGIVEDQSTLVVYGSCGPAGYKNVRFQVDGNFVTIYESGLTVNYENGPFSLSSNVLHDYDNNHVWETHISIDPIYLSSGIVLDYYYGNDNGAEVAPLLPEVPCLTESYHRMYSLEQENTVIPLHCWQRCDLCEEGVEVTLAVDMSNQVVPEGEMNLASNAYYRESSSLGTSIIDDDNDQIYFKTFITQPGTYYYDFYLGNAYNTDSWHATEWALYDLSECLRQFTAVDDPLSIQYCWGSCESECPPAVPPAPITFEINMNAYEFVDDIEILVLNGSWFFGGMDGATSIVLEDEDGDNIYSVTSEIAGPAEIWFRFGGDLSNLELFGEWEIPECTDTYAYIDISRSHVRSGIPETLHFIYNECDYYSSADDYGFIDGDVFLDVNQNGIQDEDDYPANNISILYDQNQLGDITSSNGHFIFHTDVGLQEIQVQLPESFICTTNNDLVSTTVVAGPNNHLDPIGIYSEILDPQIDAHAIGIGTICNEGGFFSLNVGNVGMLPFDAILEFTPHPAIVFDSCAVPIDSIVGGTYFMTIDSLLPFQQENIEFYVHWPDFSLLGTPLTSIFNVCSSNGISCTEVVWESPLLCAYDPNDKTVFPAGWSDEGFVLADGDLEYLVRFQNTGNYPATNVRIEDVLDPSLDYATLQILATSHPLTDFQILEDGRAKFFFNNIILPDSNSNEPGSHGYILYRISPQPDAEPLADIENTAEIYFDYNPAVITNTVHNTIFDCSLMTTDIVMEAMACAGDLYSQDQPVEYAENYAWTLDGEVLSTEQLLSFQTSETGTLNFQLEASNPLCVVNYTFPVDVNPVPATPEITQSGNELIATEGGIIYTWYLEGQQIAQGASNSFLADESGNYSVQVSNQYGCSAMSDVLEVTVGVDELSDTQWSVSPNPATTQITIQCTQGGIRKIILYNALNQVVFTTTTSAKTLLIERNELPAGVYYLNMILEGSDTSDSKKIIFE